jgi:hypothetical protein
MTPSPSSPSSRRSDCEPTMDRFRKSIVDPCFLASRMNAALAP